jgi:NAD+-dependent protein deacetylase SIR2
MLGDCDDGVRKLAAALGWLEELEALWEAANPRTEEVGKESRSADRELEAQVDELTREVETALKISSEHTDRVKYQLAGEGKEKKENASNARGTESLAAKSEDGIKLTQEAEASQPELQGGLRHVFPHI